jgi:ribosomal-protein-alanine N-acetyltransferase
MTNSASMIETDRLRFEPLAAAHLAGYTALIVQPDVHRHLSRADDIVADPAGQAARIIKMSGEQWATRGYGPFAIFEKTGPTLIGRGGLFWIEALKEVEINYMFDPTRWGRGYATEAARLFLALGFGTHRFDRMVATTNPANRASEEVLRKVGMRAAGIKDLGHGRLAKLHMIDRASWESAQIKVN